MTAPLREQTPAAVHASRATPRWLVVLRSLGIPAAIVGSFLILLIYRLVLNRRR